LNAPETIAPVLKGAYGVFAVTNFLEQMNAAPEITQGKAIADAAKAEGVQHLVWSSLLNVTKRMFTPHPNVILTDMSYSH
jgi:uncharacterized protein YbjT (DUF2867 family)